MVVDNTCETDQKHPATLTLGALSCPGLVALGQHQWVIGEDGEYQCLTQEVNKSVETNRDQNQVQHELVLTT